MLSTTTPVAFERLYAEVQQFYAHHMHLLDAGAAGEWAATFTEDAEVLLPLMTEPARGREALTTAVARAAAERAERGEIQRHWHGMVCVRPDPDGRTVRVRCYALVFLTVRGGSPVLHRTCVCEDEMVRDHTAGGWLIRRRTVTRDDLS
ncbi:nuclear transport factor 2 family protein [Streptomyces sp. NPDC000345]|uniref:nuclear transport factor 2 family protein n=1 Tax=Streptomyces sp. NPDC000345 TaxID=3364537 RepID=UPI00369322B1